MGHAKQKYMRLHDNVGKQVDKLLPSIDTYVMVSIVLWIFTPFLGGKIFKLTTDYLLFGLKPPPKHTSHVYIWVVWKYFYLVTIISAKLRSFT